MKRLACVVVLALVPRLAAADKLDDAVVKTDKASEDYKAVLNQYTDLYAKWERYYKPIDAQYAVAADLKKKADDACAKSKYTKNCHDLTLAYTQAFRQHYALKETRDAADPKHEFSPEALKIVEKDLNAKKSVFETLKTSTIKMFEEAYKKVRTKEDKDKLDAKLAKKEEKRGDKFAEGRSSKAQSQMPQGNSTSTSSGTTRTNGYDPTKTINDTTSRW